MALLAVFSVSVAETLVGKSSFEDHREYIAGALAIGGAVAWSIGRWIEARRLAAVGEDGGSRRFLLFDLRYWGPMLLAFGVITLFIRPLKKEEIEQVYAAAKPVVQKVLPKALEPAPPSQPATFPDLKMQGVIFRKSKPFAIIDGDSYTIGDRIGEVIVRAIDRTSVLLELNGETRLLTLN